jgi:hypothetical protein
MALDPLRASRRAISLEKATDRRSPSPCHRSISGPALHGPLGAVLRRHVVDESVCADRVNDRLHVVKWNVRFLWATNFLIFGGMAAKLGGDAWNGYAEKGHYFLRQHGQFTQVSESVFQYSWWHVFTVVWSFPIVMIGNLATKPPEQRKLRWR